MMVGMLWVMSVIFLGASASLFAPFCTQDVEDGIPRYTSPNTTPHTTPNATPNTSSSEDSSSSDSESDTSSLPGMIASPTFSLSSSDSESDVDACSDFSEFFQNTTALSEEDEKETEALLSNSAVLSMAPKNTDLKIGLGDLEKNFSVSNLNITQVIQWLERQEKQLKILKESLKRFETGNEMPGDVEKLKKTKGSIL